MPTSTSPSTSTPTKICKYFKALFIYILTFITPTIASPNELTNFNQDLMTMLIAEQLAGITWSTIDKGHITIGSAGFSHLGELTPMKNTSKVHVGSVTKVLLSIGVLRLVSENKLALNTKITTLLPALAIKNPWQASAPITVKHLLEHTAGLDNIRMWQLLNTSVTPTSPLTNAFQTKNQSLLTVRSKPGSQYSYSNMGYTLLGMIIEEVVQQNYETYLDENLLKPLGMSDSTFLFTAQTGAYQDNELAMGYLENKVEQMAIPLSLRPAGQFTTTALDMAKFSRFLLGNGQNKGREFINNDLMELLAYPSGTDAANAGLTIGHGLALAGRDRHGILSLCHPGTTFGYRAYFCISPQQKKSFFYAINTDNDSANYEQFNIAFIDKLTLKKTPKSTVSVERFNFSEMEGMYVDAPNNMAQFTWLDLVFNFKYITWQDNHLLLRSLQNKNRKLHPLSNHSFRAADRNIASHVLVKTDNNEVLLSDGLHTYKKYPFIKLLFLWLSLVAGLIALVSILFFGLYKLIRKRFNQQNLLFWPFINIISLSVPIFAFSQQHFLQFGDITFASTSLAIVTGLIPLSTIIPTILNYRKKRSLNVSILQYLTVIVLLQWWLVLFYWDMLPAIFWS